MQLIYISKGRAGRLLYLAVEDLRAKGISPVYLLTDHTGFYERYGWGSCVWSRKMASRFYPGYMFKDVM